MPSPWDQPVWSFHPWWNAYAKEKGQTRWRTVRFSYKYRDTGDTRVVKTVVGTVAGRNARYDPPRYSIEGRWYETDDIWGVGMFVSASTDGVHFRTVHRSHMLTCAPAK